MNGTRQFYGELLSILKNKKVLIPVIAVILVPLLYSSLFLWAFWDPYAKMDVLPVAVVNEDHGAALEGKEMNVGSDFVEKLKKKSDFQWHFVSMDEALQGMKDKKYYMAIEIPENFSSRAMSVMDPNPTPAEIKFIPHESYNFLASQIGGAAMERIKGEVSKNLTEAYAETVMGGIKQLADGIGQAGDGAGKLAAGANDIKNGIELVDTNLSKLTEGTAPLTKGIKDLLDASGQINTGMGDLKTGAVALNGGLSQLEAGGSQLSQGLKQSGDGIAKLQTGVNASQTGSAQLAAGSQAITQGLQQYAEAHPELQKDPNFVKLLETSKTVSTGMGASVEGQKALAAGLNQLASGQTELQAGADTLTGKLGEAKQGSSALIDGSAKLQAGGTQLRGGLLQLSGGAEQLASGAAQLNEGTRQLSTGADTLAGGTNELSAKLSDAKKETSQFNVNDNTVKMMASPVLTVQDKYTEVPNYGTGFAPYFISLGAFVGALLLTIVFPMKQPAVAPRSGFGWFLGKFGITLTVGTIQGLIMDAVLLGGLGLHVKSVPLFILFTILTSITFMSLIQFLVTLFGDVGRFAAIVILIFQLTTCAGTFPVELIPNVMQKIHHWLPMTYTVTGFKEVVSSGNFDIMWGQAGILLTFAVLFNLGTMAFLMINFRRKPSSADTALPLAG